MQEVIERKNDMQVLNWKNDLLDSSSYKKLRERIHQAEKLKQNPFYDFTDVEMIQWYLHRRQHLDRTHDKTERTIKEYARELSLFVEHLLHYSHEINLDIDYIIEGSLFKSLEPWHMEQYHDWLAESSPHVLKYGSYSPATLARKTTIIKSFLSFLYEVGYITKPLHKRFFVAKVKKDDRPNRDLGPKEVIQLLHHFEEIEHPIMFSIIHVLTTTGLRNEEFCRLKVKDLQYDTTLECYYLDVIGKGNKNRQIPLREKTLESIMKFRKARELPSLNEAAADSPLFTTNTEKPYTPSYLSQYLTKAIEKTELPFVKNRKSRITPHHFRHAHAIISRQSKVDIYDIMRSLGHEKIETTMIYLEKIFEKDHHAINEWKPEVFGEFI